MNFFTWTNTNNWVSTFWSNSLSNISNSVGRNFGYQYFATPCILHRPKHHFHALLQGNIETSHLCICNGQYTARTFFLEKWYHRTTTPHYVSITDNAKRN